jgi:4-amino-4-deoxy-L-arabinose transferase-like glycosyltransferase
MRLMTRRIGPARLPVVLLCIIAIAVAVRVGFVMTLEEDLYWPDPHYYDDIAWRLVSGEPIGEAILRGPFQAFVMAVPYAVVGHSYRAAYLFQALLGGFIPLLVFLIGRRAGREAAGLLAALLSALYPYYVYIAGVLYATQTTTILLLLLVYLAFVCRGRPRAAASVAQGAALGLTILSLPTAMSLVPAAFAWSLRGKRPILLGLLVIATAAAVVVPWTVRNYIVTGEFIPVSVSGGAAFLLGNNPLATASSGSSIPYPYDLQAIRRGSRPGEWDRLCWQRGLLYVREHPGRALRLYGAKLLNLYRFYPSTQTKNEFTNSRTNLISAATYGPMLLLALVGLWIERRRWRLYLPILLTIGVFTIVYPAFTTNVRYRLPIDAYFILFCSVAIGSIAGRFSERMARAFAPSDGPVTSRPTNR